MARAISSLPVPVSPRMSTVESDGATLATCVNTLRMTLRRADDFFEHRRVIDLFAQRQVFFLSSLFGPFAIVDVGPRRVPANDPSLFVLQGVIADQKPPILPVLPAST